jgi:hypothetical protein
VYASCSGLVLERDGPSGELRHAPVVRAPCPPAKRKEQSFEGAAVKTNGLQAHASKQGALVEGATGHKLEPRLRPPHPASPPLMWNRRGMPSAVATAACGGVEAVDDVVAARTGPRGSPAWPRSARRQPFPTCRPRRPRTSTAAISLTAAAAALAPPSKARETIKP